MENEMQNNVTQNAPEAAVQAKPAKKKGKILAIVIPLVVVLIIGGIIGGMFISKNNQYEKALQMLDDGEISDAIEIHQKLGDYKDLAGEICDGAESQCKKLLKKGSYSKIAKLYKTVSEYPDAVEGMNEQVTEHLDTLLTDRDYEEILLVREGFSEAEAVHTMILDQISAAADKLWRKDQYSTLEFYKELMEEKIYLDAMDKNIVKLICEMIDYQSYWEALNYCELIAHNDECLADIQKAFIEEAKSCMENYEYWAVDNLYYTMLDFEQDMEPLQQVIYEHACALMEQGDYDVADLYFSLLGDYEDCAEKREEIVFMEVIETLEEYIEYGWYYDAEWLINNYSGEQKEKLLEIYLSYCGDETFIADLEAALLERAAAAEKDASYQELIDIENAYLEKYWNMPFYDDNLYDLAYEYLYALENQEEVVKYYVDYEYYDYYEFIYRWNLASADRYMILDKLNEGYGFGSGNAQLESLLGTGENLRDWTYAWYDIHWCLSNYLWDYVPYEEDGVYYLDVYNYTSYTFSFEVYQQFCSYDGTVLAEYGGEYLVLEPGETYRVIIGYPEGEDVSYWYIDWEIYDIYYEGVLLG